MMQDDSRIGAKIRNLRLRSNISLRQLAKDADVSVSYLSSIEKNAVSPTLATLRKVLVALGTNFFDFFNEEEKHTGDYVFKRVEMKSVADNDREYTFILPRRDDIALEMMDELYSAARSLPEFETFENDFTGYVLDGVLSLEIGEGAPANLEAGDAFYVPAGIKVRGYCQKGTARVITIMLPADPGKDGN